MPKTRGMPKKTDNNHAQIVQELTQAFYDVDDVHEVLGFYDIIVHGIGARTGMIRSLRVEIKSDPDALLNPGRHLTDAEKEYWARQKYPFNLIIATSTEDVLDWFQNH